MEQRRLGSTGLMVSALGFGCGAVGGLMVRGDRDEQRRAVSRALDAGITYFDTADQYGEGRSERLIGQTFKGRRDQVVIGGKFGYDFYNHRRSEGHSEIPQNFDPSFIRFALEQSLTRLQTDYLDLWLIHAPAIMTASSIVAQTSATRWLGVRVWPCQGMGVKHPVFVFAARSSIAAASSSASAIATSWLGLTPSAREMRVIESTNRAAEANESYAGKSSAIAGITSSAAKRSVSESSQPPPRMMYWKPARTSPRICAIASSGVQANGICSKLASKPGGRCASLARAASRVSARRRTTAVVRSIESYVRPTSAQCRRSVASLRRTSSGVKAPPAQDAADRFDASPC